MATHKSALKAHRRSVVRRDHNREFRSKLRTALKSIRAALDAGDLDKAKAALRQTVGIIDRTAGKGIIHRNTAARYKSRLVKRVAKSPA